MKVLPSPEDLIDTDGVYDLPIERYHSQCCAGPSISSSGLRRLFQSPAHFWLESDLNPNRLEQKASDALNIGRAAHHAFLGEAAFEDHFVVRPDEFPDWRIKASKEWRAEQELAGKTVLAPADVETIRGMAGLLPWQKGMANCGLANTPIVAESGALSGEVERSLIWRFGDIWLKARPDVIAGGSGDFVDLKTTTSVADRDLARTVFDLGYHVQGALIGMAAKAVLGIDMTSFTLVFVEKSPPYSVAVKTLTDEDLILGEAQIFAAIKLFERGLKTGAWPGPTAQQTDAQFLNLPQWGRDEITRRVELIEREIAL